MSTGNFWLKLLSASGGKKPILALAPMAGVSDSAFRQICKEQGADVVYTEMVSADGLFHEGKKTLEFLKFAKSERPIVIQLFGKYPEKFAKAAKICEETGFDGIDINFGCPAQKVAGHGGGVTLMRDLPKCREIIEATIRGTKLPVSVKLRSSIGVIASAVKQSHGIASVASLPRNDSKITALDFIKFMKDLPIAAVMIHGRPYEKPFDGEIDFKMIKAVKDFYKKTKTVVLANGGIKTPEDAKIILEKTGADGIGLARGLYGRPYLFSQIKNFLKSGKYKAATQKEIIKIILRHAALAEKAKGEHGLIELRKHLLWYVSGWSNAKELRSKLVRVEKINEIRAIFKGVDN
ncbi:MAG: tRNA-dihydrouridine synthase [Patescibacteria group bacterium]